MFTTLQRNLFPALAVLILPVGYYVGVQLREENDTKAMKAQLEQLSAMERQAQLEQQRTALLEEKHALLSKLKQNEN
ncbi:hypothetical protein BCR42DRAFT_417034 [Absidia repens]|uniref:Uncharacterized protein n=1 Tax=Absidia repens TaxID=90262 RepID=A0A1X2IDA7_9FUNG|nr:hypothetical protein BCR42DRAFT_417034 [Absidia repens]